MIDPRNNGNLTAGLVAVPEVIETKNSKIVKFRLAVPFAGNDKANPDDKRGFFDATYFANPNDPSSKFILSQVEAGNFKQGTTLQFVYRLAHDRWTSEDGTKNSKVNLIIESAAYASSPPRPSNDDDSSSESVTMATTF